MKAFAYTNIVKELNRSSSGGAFIGLCCAFEKLHGADNVAFCGAELMKDMTVKHNIVYSAEDSHRFQGSKYVKSQIGGIYGEIESLLRQGKAVLFSGTPCQVAGIHKYLDAKTVNKDKFLSVDIICHGTPDVKVWTIYKEWLEKGAKSRLIDYSFRYKQVGWLGYPAYARFENGKELIDTKETSVYSKLHLLGYSITKGCFQCPFANMERTGDITIGDFWGIEDEKIDIDSTNGVLLILVNTYAGEMLINEVAGNLVPVSGNGYYRRQHNLSKPTEMPERYFEFWKDIQEKSFEKILQKYLRYNTVYTIRYILKHMVKKIGLLSLYRRLREKIR